MKTHLLLTCLLSLNTVCGNEEIAAVSKPGTEVPFSEMDHLKAQIVILQRQIIEAEQTKEEIQKTIVKNKQAQYSALEFVKKEVADLKSQLAAASQKEVAFWGKSKKENADSDPSITSAGSSRICCTDLVPAYNAPAGITTVCSWDVWADASFTYWQAMQDNMEVGALSHQFDQGVSAYDTLIKAGTTFSPGFKIGTGIQFDYDNWDLYTEYTWFRSKASVFESTPASLDFYADYYQIWPTVGGGETLSDSQFSFVSSSWSVHMDIIEAALGRWYYVGTELTFHPYAGLRSAFIRQKRRVDYGNTVPEITHASVPSANILQNSNSWSLGPEMGIDLNWTIYKGLRLITSFEADILYTQYTRIHNSDNGPFPNPHSVIANTERNLGCIRTHADMEMGLGYGFYSFCDKYYFDFSATYGFQAFFDQNMFHTWYGSSSVRQGLATIGNLYIQGLTASADFHF